MLDFLKTFGQGILFVIISPILAVIFAFYLIYAFFTYVILEILSLLLFFRGKNYNSDDYETEMLNKVKENYRQQRAAQAAFVQQQMTSANSIKAGDNNVK